jgi:predicted acylesterase/phospholipase RssA
MVRLIIDRTVLPYSDVKTFDDFPVPFRCVATDLFSGKPITASQGRRVTSVRQCAAETILIRFIAGPTNLNAWAVAISAQM